MIPFRLSHSTDSFQIAQRKGSLNKVLDLPNNSAFYQNKPQHKVSLSFHNFKLVNQVSQTNSMFKPNKSTIQEEGQPLKESTNGLPKVSSQPVSRAKIQLSDTLSTEPIMNRRASNMEPFYYDSYKKTNKTTFFSQSPKNSLLNAHSQIFDPKSKYALDQSTNLTIKHNGSMISQKKQDTFPKKLPLKRRALDKDVRDVYTVVIHSKEHGNYKDFMTKMEEKSPMSPTDLKAKNKMDALKAMEEVKLDKEDQRKEDEIKVRGLKDFHRKIAVYNFIRGNYLVEPEEDRTVQSELGLSIKLIKAPRPEKDTKSDAFANWAQTYGLQHDPVKSKALMRENIEKLVASDTNRTEAIQSQREAENNKQKEKDREKKDVMKSTITFKQSFLVGKKKDENLESDLKRIKDIGEMIKGKKALSEEEQLVFKLVKAGVETDLGYLLAKSNELVNVVDNRKETPLHWAVKRGFYHIVIALCKAGANIDARDMANRRPVDLAERLGTNEILEYLKILHKKKELDNRFGQAL